MENPSLLTVLLICISVTVGGAEISHKIQETPNGENSTQLLTLRNIPNCTSTSFYAPVCASNGVTYHNSAVFDCDFARKGGGLQILHYGSCQERSRSLSHFLASHLLSWAVIFHLMVF